MRDRVEAASRAFVVKDQLAQSSAIDAPIADILGAEGTHDLVESCAAGCVHGVGRLVGIDHLGA
jgi:hypothetical protein